MLFCLLRDFLDEILDFIESVFEHFPTISYQLGCASFPFGFEDRMWDRIVLVPDHCHFLHCVSLETVMKYMCAQLR